MSKLYPPIIGDKIPGFYKNTGDNKVIISVPFENNRSVSYPSIYSIVLRLKTIQTDTFVYNALPINSDTDLNGRILQSIIEDTKIVHFEIESDKLNVGQFYKIQLAYIEIFDITDPEDRWQNHIGYYSNVGINKFTSEPNIIIADLVPDSTNDRSYTFVGAYEQKRDDSIMDTTEKVYQYKFLIEKDGNVIKDSGWLMHNANTDLNEYTSFDEWEYLVELPAGGASITYKVITNSGIEFNSPTYDIADNSDSVQYITLTPYNNFDDGYIEIIINGNSGTGIYLQADNNLIVREDKNTGIKTILGKPLSVLAGELGYRDFTTEQGHDYAYEVWTVEEIVNSGITSYLYHINPASDTVYADYEYIFLQDGERQLKIKYNTQVSGIHETILESKIDTIGSQYPIFFRNGNVRYRDFTLNGLISFQMDENRLFSEYGVEDQPSRERTYTAAVADQQTGRLHSFVIPTDLVGENFYHERMFREDVLAWLNDGKLKLFRSPSEGIMMVRIMNVNMTPEQIPSRMIYNFSCQVYEATGHDYEDLVKAKIINRG